MKILVVDTVGGNRFSAAYKDYFPNATLRGLELRDDGPCHPHGYQCGYYAGVLTALLKEPCEIVFARIFDGQGAPVPKSNEWILDVITKEQPDYISNSWGQSDGDTRFGDMAGQLAWQDWVKFYRKAIGDMSVSFFAAGNDDHNDKDVDVDYPQRLIPDDVCIIGSHNRAGIPSEFSGDGAGVLCTMWGENVALLSQDQWHRGSGTSFSCPKAAGLCAFLGLSNAEFRLYAASNCSRPDDYQGLIPSAKWGLGSLEHKYQEYLARLPEELQPPIMRSNIKVTEWRDFREAHSINHDKWKKTPDHLA